MDEIDYSLFVPNVHFEKIPICDLVSNQDYQRALSKDHILKTAENFDLYQINPAKVSRRDGLNYVFDGQHTIEVVALVSGSRETPVWCMVYDDMGYIKEADTFANQQKHVKRLSPYDVFNANIEAENSTQREILTLVNSYHLKITKAKDDCCIGAVGALEYIYNKFGIDVLDRTLRLIVMAWEGEADSLLSGMLKGVAIFLVAFGDQIHDELFTEKLGIVSPKEIIRTAKERRAGSKGYAEAIYIYYTKKMKYNRLPMTNIYLVGRGQKINQPIDEQPTGSDEPFDEPEQFLLDAAVTEKADAKADDE